MTLASFIKVTQAVFFGQTPAVCEDAKEVPFSMRLPMWIMAVLCVVTGIFYPVVEKTLLAPAVSAASGLTTYVDKMMGEGYAAAAGVTESALPGFTFSYWDPVLWLVLFVVVFFAVGFVIVTGKGSRGRVSQGADGSVDAKYDTFFSGEKSLHSHVGGSDLFWGFKHEWKGYFRVMQSAHSGVVNDYTIWTVVAAAVILAVVFIFVH